MSAQNLKRIFWFFAVFSFLGFADATFLTVEHYLGTPIPCSILGGCDVVTNSLYSQIGPVPIALIGALYYLTLIILSIIYFDSKKEVYLKIGAYLSVSGFLVSLVLVYLQVSVIHALCLYCMISALFSTILFLLGQVMLYNLRHNKEQVSI